MKPSIPDPSALTALMSGLRGCFAKDESRIAARLPRLLNILRGLALENPYETAADSKPPASAAIANLLDNAREPFGSLDGSGLLSDPWAAAALRRDEVRNASVLRWFLDPRGNHGCGDAILKNLLARVATKLTDSFPEIPSPGCLVSVEQCPDGDRANRVDIQVDDTAFFLVIEVKIDAPDQNRQLERYCAIAAARTGGARPWAVVYLTAGGRPAATAGHLVNRVVALSWSQLGASLREAARALAPIPSFLATSFANHVSNL
ncbi:PD-(D/E)XK nuclease family protein [Novosphingobium sp. 1949]|uniref:PD-(D/E)XK nuclease family protein n=1 Tax=Novosphingobium organovorum TaxID=2930092 RepID=A0ABT0BAU0_9SPHN|nr:PD-(D/E)XK nuclease family protein [Novosphingobium organovorum]MCJ2182181.1 PD-(D/E)XK nuclease family protein [Novosphingobium organovorum]